MRRVILLVVGSLALMLAAPASSANTVVQIKRTGFVPVTVTINQNDSVTWKNVDTINHQVVANGGSFASPILAPGKTYTRPFRNGGTFRYHDSPHPSLTGTVSNKKAGETVTLVQLPFGQTTKQIVATLQTTTNGVFSFNVTPQIFTQYQAQWKTLESSVFIQVQPMIKLPYVSKSGYYHFYVTASQSFAGRFVLLQRFTLAKTWVNLRRLQLGSKSGRILAVGAVRKMIPRGRWSVRIFMPATEMPGGYLDAWSGTQPVVRR